MSIVRGNGSVAELLDRWSGTKDSTFENFEVGEALGPVRIEVDDALVKQYAFCMDDYRDWHFTKSPFGPPVAHAALLANDLLTVYYTNYDRSTVTGLHTDEELRFVRPVPVGTTVTITGRITEKYVRRDNGYVALEAEARDESGNVLIRHRSVEIMRVEQPGDLVGRGAATPSKSEWITTDVEPITPAAHVRPGLTSGTPLVPLTKFLTQEQISVYSFVGEHERNFHNDLELARAGGLDNTIAQGLQTAGYFSDICTGFFGAEWLTSGRIKAKFTNPVYPSSELRVGGKVARQEMTPEGLRTHVELWTHDQDQRLVSVAWASACGGNDAN